MASGWRSLLFESIHVHVPSTNEDHIFTGSDAERQADAWLLQHVQSPPAWEWSVILRVRLEGGHTVQVDHTVMPGRTGGCVRGAVVRHILACAFDSEVVPQQQADFHDLAQRVHGRLLPRPVLRRRFDWATGRDVLDETS